MILTIFRRAFGVTLGDDGLPPADCGRSVPEESQRKKKKQICRPLVVFLSYSFVSYSIEWVI